MKKLDWANIQTVLLDMDGTLLDLYFDNHFWLEHVPKKLVSQGNYTFEQAQQYMMSEYEKVQGTINWYCLDFWADKLDMDIVEAKREIQHLIKMREDTIPFLDALRESGREVVLVTNAHPDSLSLKVERTQLDQHIDLLISTHEFGVTKESQLLWEKLQAKLRFSPESTLFVDDSLPILEAAKEYGIGYLLAVNNPDSKQPVRDITHFNAIEDYRVLINDIKTKRFVANNVSLG